MSAASAAFPYILDVLKGIAITVVCLIGACLQHSLLGGDLDWVTYKLTWVISVAMLFGAGFGAIAGFVKTDRLLHVLASVLAIISCLLFVGAGDDHTFDWHLEVFSSYPWILIGGVVLVWWTRRPEPATLPAMRLRSSGVRLRRLTPVELSVLMWVAAAVVIALDIDPEVVGDRPRGDVLWDGPEGYHDSYETYEGPNRLAILGILATFAVPIGVGVGVIAARQFRFRIAALLAIAFVAAIYAKAFIETMSYAIDVPSWGGLVILVATIAIDRLTHAGNATSRDAGSTSTTP